MVIFILLSAKNGQSYKKIVSGSLVLFFLMAFKSENIGSDTPNYIEFFYRLKYTNNMIDSNSRFEKGYQVYNKMLGLLSDNHQILFIVTAIICIGLISFCISKISINWMYSLFLLIGFRFYYFFMTGIRQSIALALVFLSYIFLIKNKTLCYILTIIIAIYFHFSAFIFILALPLYKMKINYKNISIVSVIILINFIFADVIINKVLEILPAYYSGYLLTESFSTNNLTDIVGVLMPILFLIFAHTTNYIQNIESCTYFNGSNNNYEYMIKPNMEIFFLIFSAGLSLMATRASIIDRMVQYYWIFSICTIPNMIFSIENKKKRTIYFLIITFFVLCYNISILAYRPEWSSIVPYEFCF